MHPKREVNLKRDKTKRLNHSPDDKEIGEVRPESLLRAQPLEVKEPGELVDDDDGSEHTDEELQEYANWVESRLSKCAVDQPYDDGEPVWMNGHTTLDDVMDTVGVPQECKEQVAEMVHCPSCRDSHDLWEEVGVKSDGELRYENLMVEWYEKHEFRLDDFYAHLERYPYLGVGHALGQEIRDTIAKFPVTTLTDAQWYRARRVKDGKSMTAGDFNPPDPSKVPIPEGRFNHHGQSVLYFADARKCAALECVEKDESLAWVQKFRIREIGNVLDLSLEENWADDNLPALALGLMHSGAVRRFVERTSSWKPEYFVPRFVADCAREKGFNGILFKSVRHFGNNLVLFSPDPANVAAEGDPELTEMEDRKSSSKFLNAAVPPLD
jgi:hypothetical protein